MDPSPSPTSPPKRSGLPAWPLAVIPALLSLVVIHAGYGLSSVYGEVPGTWPYFDGGVSVSRANRQLPALHVFRGGVLPSAGLLVLVWVVALEWLRAESIATARKRATIRALGMLGAVFLVLYAVTLGTEGQAYRLMRRFGIYVFFGGTGIAQVLVAWQLRGSRIHARHRSIVNALGLASLAMLSMGPGNMIADLWIDNTRLAKALEWWLVLLMLGSFAGLGELWRRERVVLDLRSSPGTGPLETRESADPKP